MHYLALSNFTLIFFLISFSCNLQAQDSTPLKKLTADASFAEKGTHWLNFNLGLSVMNSDLGNFEDPFLLADENRRNFGFIFQPKFQVFIKDRLSVGFHLGVALDEFENKQIDFQQNKNNYFAGLQTEYYFLNVKNIFYISTELDAGMHYLENKFKGDSFAINDSYHTYFKSGLHLNFSFMLQENWVFYAKFFDLISYTTSENNFFGYDEGIQFNNSLDNFINFPQFGVVWKLF